MAASFNYGLVSAKNENILALSNVNLDFSLVKFVPPPEYHGLGLSLSPKRRKEAEDGPIHAVARKLALLLCQDLPDIPNLLKAYGSRASKIAEDPVFNPRGTALDGAFREHIGLDGASLWASATSGKDTVALHLLACILSRIWKRKAVSIWAELVERRKANLKASLERDIINANDLTASAIQLSRDQLADWDASARSWLESADLAYSGKQKQLMLILDNLDISIASGSDIFGVVTDVWKVAMQFMENIVAGRPHSVKSGEVLLAMSAWHLYPDLEIIQGKRTMIKQNDPLIAHGGIVTIGLENPNADNLFGISWSLPLSHLQYYGKAVLATGAVNSSSSRVSMEQLVMVAFGGATGTWASTTKDIDTYAKILAIIEKTLVNGNIVVPEWLSLLSSASKTFLESSGEARLEFERLFAFGQRRATNFLARTGKAFLPCFNLHKVLVFCNVLEGSEVRIQWLRTQYDRITNNQPTKTSRLQYALLHYQDTKGVAQDMMDFKSPVLSGPTHGPHSHPQHPDHRAWYYMYEEFGRSRASRTSEFASLAPVYVGDDGKPSHRRWISALAMNRTNHHSYKGCRYCPISTFAVERAARLRSRKGESITFLLDDHVSYNYSSISHGSLGSKFMAPMSWVACHVTSSPAKVLLGAELDQEPKSVSYIYASPGGFGFNPAEQPMSVRLEQAPNASSTASLWNSVIGFTGTIKSIYTTSQSRLLREIQSVESQLQQEVGNNAELSQMKLRTPSTLGWQFDNHLHNLLQHSFEDFSRSTSPGRLPTAKDSLDVTNNGNISWRCQTLTSQSISDCLHGYYLFTERYDPSDKQEYMRLSPGWSSVALYLPLSASSDESHHLHQAIFPDLTPEELLENLESAELDPTQLALCLDLEERNLECVKSFDALAFASKLYKDLPDARVELAITSTPLSDYHWSKSTEGYLEHARSFACIASFETGHLNTDPSTINEVMGISVGSSLYIAQFLWSDPYSPPPRSVIRRSIGNVGKKGMAFLISPQDPNVKEPGYENWKVVQHAIFDGSIEDNFPETSLHFTFTGYELALNTGEHGLRDKEVYFLQSVVQAYERGNWIADLDILKALISPESDGSLRRLPHRCSHETNQANDFKSLGLISSIDCWDELLDDPGQMAIVRAKGNWLARLAVTVVAFQKKKQVIIADGKVCWACVKYFRTNHKTAEGGIIVC